MTTKSVQISNNGLRYILNSNLSLLKFKKQLCIVRFYYVWKSMNITKEIVYHFLKKIKIKTGKQ